MPGGDDDDEMEDDCDDEVSIDFTNDVVAPKRTIKLKELITDKPLPCADKFMALYDDAKHRNLRQEHIYAKCIDKECTFKPVLITKNSKVSQSTIKEV